MRVVVLGHTRLERSWKRDLAEAGTALGWDVEHLHGDRPDPAKVVRAATGADLFVWAHTPGFLAPEGLLDRIRDLSVPTAGVHLDLYWGRSHKEDEVGALQWWGCDHVFTADGGHDEEFAARGVRHHWMPQPAGRRHLGRAEPDRARWPHDVVFVGGRYPGRPYRQHRERLVQWAAGRYGQGFAAYGQGRRRRVYGRDLSALISSARVVLGDSVISPFYWSDRLPLMLARGAVLAHPPVPGMAEQGFTREMYLPYEPDTFGPLGDRIDALTGAEARAMSQAGMQLVADRHLWEHRLEAIARLVLNAGPTPPPGPWCPGCGRGDIGITKAGRWFKHNDAWAQTCSGSGEPATSSTGSA